jgi:hypothetical protein
MKKDYYVIELENGKFALFSQESSYEIAICSWSIDKIHLASLMSEDDATEIFEELNDKESEWTYYGDCLVPKAIRKITLELH